MNRIKELRASTGTKQSELAAAIKVSQAALSGYETGKFEADIATYKKIAAFFNVTLDYLLGDDLPTAPDAVKIPVLGSVPAGIPLEAVEDILDWEEISLSMCNGGKEYFALEVQGDSMWPDYLPGDIVIVRKSPTCDSGDVCVVYVNGYDATLKQVMIGENGSISLIPKNQSYPPRTFSREEVIELPVSIAGVVVELRRKIQKARGML